MGMGHKQGRMLRNAVSWYEVNSLRGSLMWYNNSSKVLQGNICQPICFVTWTDSAVNIMRPGCSIFSSSESRKRKSMSFWLAGHLNLSHSCTFPNSCFWRSAMRALRFRVTRLKPNTVIPKCAPHSETACLDVKYQFKARSEC
jgi:hypothetical protein